MNGQLTVFCPPDVRNLIANFLDTPENALEMLSMPQERISASYMIQYSDDVAGQCRC